MHGWNLFDDLQLAKRARLQTDRQTQRDARKQVGARVCRAGQGRAGLRGAAERASSVAVGLLTGVASFCPSVRPTFSTAFSWHRALNALSLRSKPRSSGTPSIT